MRTHKRNTAARTHPPVGEPSTAAPKTTPSTRGLSAAKSGLNCLRHNVIPKWEAFLPRNPPYTIAPYSLGSRAASGRGCGSLTWLFIAVGSSYRR